MPSKRPVNFTQLSTCLREIFQEKSRQPTQIFSSTKLMRELSRVNSEQIFQNMNFAIFSVFHISLETSVNPRIFTCKSFIRVHLSNNFFYFFTQITMPFYDVSDGHKSNWKLPSQARIRFSNESIRGRDWWEQ